MAEVRDTTTQPAGQGDRPGLGPLRRRIDSLALLLLAASGIAIVALGQAQTTRDLSSKLNWLAPHARQVTDVYPFPKPVLAGMALLVLGAAIFVLATWSWARREGATLDAPGRGWGLRLRADGLLIATGLLAAIPLLVLVLRLYDDEYSTYLIPVWLVALGLAAVPFVARDLAPLSRPSPRWSWTVLGEVAFLALMVIMYAVINIHDLTHWRFSAEGDEYAFYDQAKLIAHGKPFDLWAQNGVYGYHPIMSSAYQALFLKFFGANLFAWKLSLVVLVCATLVVFYLLLRELFNYRVAMFGTAMLASSHYLFAFTHTGFISLNALFPTVLALWLLTVGLRRDSSLALYASGAAAGLGFYALFSARAAILVMGFFMLSMGRKGLRPEKLLPIAIGFALVVLPIFTLHGWDVVDQMIKQSAAEANEATGARVERFAYNIVPSIMAFNYSPTAARYVSGSLVDPVTAVLFALGLGLAIGKVRHPAFRLLLIWWAISLGVTGLANPRAEVSVTRLHYVVPAVAALAAVAFDRALTPALALAKRPEAKAAMATGAAALVLAPVLFLNLHRFWYETPRVDGLIPESVVVGAVVSKECKALPPAAVVTPYPDGLLVGIFDAYDVGDRTPTLFGYEAVTGTTASELSDGEWPGCIVVDPQADEETLNALLQRIQLLYPEKQEHRLTDLTRRGAYAYVFY